MSDEPLIFLEGGNCSWCDCGTLAGARYGTEIDMTLSSVLGRSGGTL